ncbi:MAG: alpha/beta fold hydrolase [Elusimicrobiota bacterium]
MVLLLAGILCSPLLAEEIVIHSDAGGPIGVCDLGATLVRPSDAKALVVFVAGSGTHDRDETVGRVRPFRDLADALATRGIASLRFDKRGFKDDACRVAAMSPQLSPEHFITDLVNVYDRAAQEDLPVFVLGHSEGVTYVIEAASRGRIAPKGLILLAGLGRYSLKDTLLRQLKKSLVDIDFDLSKPDLPAERRGFLEKARRDAAQYLKDGRDFFERIQSGQARDDEKFFGAYARFWREEIAMTAAAAATASTVHGPSLLLQGSRDENVTRDDFDALSAALAPDDGTARWFEGLDHFFLRSGETRVASEVPVQIADWIEARVPRGVRR